jgi:DNA-binding response OmpR family regulator
MDRRLHIEVIPISEVEGIMHTDPVRPNPVDTAAGLPVVLVVDDELIVADTLAMILSQAGFCAMKAYNAEAALALARVTPPALLLTDVQMPGKSGVQLAVELIREWPECEVLLFSGSATPRDLQPAKTAGYDFPLLTKPLHPAELLEHISATLGLVNC